METAYKAAWHRWSGFIDEPLSRYDMARIVSNLLDERGALPGEDDVLAVQESIADWDVIPENYRSAVSACWAAGILQGRSGGRFDGTESLNRALACVIWSRLDSHFSGGQDEEEPVEEFPVKEMPAFGLQGDETVQQMMNRINAAASPGREGPPAKRQAADGGEHPGASGAGEGRLPRRQRLERHHALRL